ncbi:PREDICTED: acyl-coenzyme A oxidase-like protein [Cercocebus atys]|uniref:acyl-coenzyme A oxidase-like protein n=1 Tax=Cercocebus atys TaxID=9531 RepID=UPI0005F528F0|nr:PREDICTED: acyl-coenzyme A oxidase-like protein [Cercocebus atys]
MTPGKERGELRLGGREEEQRPPEATGEEEQRPPEAAGEEEQRPPEAAEEQRPPEAAGEEEQRPPEAAGEEEQRPPEAAGEEDGYDLSLDEMRALTVQRVRFAMGLPLLKRAVQDLAEKNKEFCQPKPRPRRSSLHGGHGHRSEGPHCFIVLVRDENGSLYPGVTAIDRMYKEGLHGVDNGMVIFDKVRIPRENLLDKFGSVAPDRQYHSPTRNKSARFSAMLAALTPSRLAVAFQAMGAMKLGLTIAVRYSRSRRQFGPKTKEEVKIVEHQTQTLWLMPPLATALALTFVSRYAGALVDKDVFQGKELVNSHSLQALVAALKAYSTWENICCLQDCRECTGGMVVGRELLAQYTKQYEEKPLFGLLQNWAESVGDKLRTSFLAFNMDTVDDLAFLLKAVKFRERVLQWGLVTRIYYKVKTKKEDFFHAWNSCLHHVAFLSLAHTHRVTLEQFSLAVKSCPDQEDQTLLMKFCLLYGTKLVFQERAWYLEHKYLTPVASLRIRNQERC